MNTHHTRKTFGAIALFIGRVPPRGALFLPILAVVTFALAASAQSPQSVDTQAPTYTPVSRGPNNIVLQRVTSGIDADGSTVFRTNAYEQIATGASFMSNDVWMAASDAITITPQGGQATNSQVKAFFEADISSRSAITLHHPSGEKMSGGPLFLAYFDGTTSVVIGEIQSSIGQVLYSGSQVFGAASANASPPGVPPPAGNQILFQNAFSGVSADVLLHFRLDGFESDIVIRRSLPDPADYHLDPNANIRLQVWTEFTDLPQATVTASTDDATGLTDETYAFSSMLLGRGNSFLTGDGTVLSPVFKRLKVVQGRTFMVEEVPLSAIAAQLDQLPPRTGSLYKPGTSPQYANLAATQATPPGFGLRQPSAELFQRVVSPAPNERPLANDPKPTFTLPPPRLAAKNKIPLRLAKAPPFQKGLVLDYNIVATQTNILFSADRTFLITNSVNIYGTATYEGGTVLKFGPGGSLNMIPGPMGNPTLIWSAGPYSPVICTAKDDDTAGSQISGSSGSPSGYYGGLSLTAATGHPVISGLRMSYAATGFALTSTTINMYDAQFVNCQVGVFANSGTTLLLGDTLFANATTNLSVAAGATVNAQNTTFSGSKYLATGPATFSGSVLTLTNCVLASVTNLTSGVFAITNGNYNALYNTPASVMFGATTFTSDTYPFMAVGAANYFLTNNSNFRGVGTMNLDATLLASLPQRTTFPPVILTNTFTTDTILSPEAPRDTGTPACGYHYPPIDFLGYCAVSNATLMLTNGVAFAYFGGGIWLQNGGKLVSQGTPTQPDRLIYYNLAQEQSTNLWGGTYTAANAVLNSIPVSAYETNLTQDRTLNLRFTTVSGALGANYSMYFQRTNYVIASLAFQDCEINCAGGKWLLTYGSTSPPTVSWLNTVFPHAYVALTNGGNLTINNCLFTGSNQTVSISKVGAPAIWAGVNNAFDGPPMASLGSTFQYQAFLNGTVHSTLHTGDLVTNVTWVTGPLGPYYQPTNSALTNKGNTTADLLGLYHYTTTTNQVKETNSTVDIGFHYVALGTDGLPLSTSGDGLGDYLKDANGNGTYESTIDLGNWATNSTCGDGVSDYIKWLQGRGLTICGTNADTTGIIGLQVYTPLK